MTRLAPLTLGLTGKQDQRYQLNFQTTVLIHLYHEKHDPLFKVIRIYQCDLLTPPHKITHTGRVNSFQRQV